MRVHYRSDSSLLFWQLWSPSTWVALSEVRFNVEYFSSQTNNIRCTISRPFHITHQPLRSSHAFYPFQHTHSPHHISGTTASPRALHRSICRSRCPWLRIPGNHIVWTAIPTRSVTRGVLALRHWLSYDRWNDIFFDCCAEYMEKNKGASLTEEAE